MDIEVPNFEPGAKASLTVKRKHTNQLAILPIPFRDLTNLESKLYVNSKHHQGADVSKVSLSGKTRRIPTVIFIL
jgi:hypothetical protein